LKTTFTKRAGGVAQGGGPEFKLQYLNNKRVVWSYQISRDNSPDNED
jgi:hypothetical protein